MTTAVAKPRAAVDSDPNNRPEAIHEYVDSRGIDLRVDRELGVLRGVKLIGLESLNGRRYQVAALKQAAALYEQAKVNVNHPAGSPLAPRDYRDRLGVVRDVEFRDASAREDAGLFGDLYFNPKHSLAEQLAWDAEHCPQNVGLSHNVLARLSRDGEAVVVEEITQVRSVDLVADPAATQGLFEHDSTESRATGWDAITLETLRLHRPDLLAEIEASQTAPLREQLAAVEEHVRTLAAERISTFGAPQSVEQSEAIGARQTLTSQDFARALRR